MHGIFSLRINAIDGAWVPSTFCKGYFTQKELKYLRLVRVPLHFLGLCVAKREAAKAWESFVLLLQFLGTKEGLVEPQNMAVCSPCPQGTIEGKGAAWSILASVCPAPNTDCTKILACSLFNWLGLWWVLENKLRKRVSLVVKSHPLPMALMEALIFHGEIGHSGMSLLWLQETAGQGPEGAEGLRCLFPLKNSGVGNPSPRHISKRLTS